MRVDPDHAPRLSRGGCEAGERPHGDRVVAAEHERPGALPHRPLHQRRELGAGVEDLRQIPCPLVDDRECLGLRRHDIASIRDGEADLRQALLEPGVPDRRRAHVDAAPGLAEVEGRTDDRDGTLHGAEPYLGRGGCARTALHFATAAR